MESCCQSKSLIETMKLFDPQVVSFILFTFIFFLQMKTLSKNMSKTFQNYFFLPSILFDQKTTDKVKSMDY